MYLRGHNWVHFAHRLIVYSYLEFKLRCHRNLKLFSIRVKELFEPIVLHTQKKKGDEFLLFLKAFSWETDLWVTLGDFGVKKRKIGKGNVYLTKNRWSRNEMRCASDNHNNMCHTGAYVQKNFKIRTSIEQLFTKKQFLTKLSQISHIHKNHNF